MAALKGRKEGRKDGRQAGRQAGRKREGSEGQSNKSFEVKKQRGERG